VRPSHPAELLLDIHALLWWLAEPNRLSPAAHEAIADPSSSRRAHLVKRPAGCRSPRDGDP